MVLNIAGEEVKNMKRSEKEDVLQHVKRRKFTGIPELKFIN